MFTNHRYKGDEMKVLLTAVLSIAMLANQACAGEKKMELKSEKDKVSYSIGLEIGSSFKKQGIDIDTDAVAAGIKDAISASKPLLTENEVKEVMMAFQKGMAAKQAEKMKGLAEKNTKEGESFLAENKKKEGVKTTASGLQYKVITPGGGPMPKDTDTVSVNYRGTLIDGTEFDSSYKRGEAVSFPVNGVIKGWTEALQLMKVGSKWQLFIPSNIAYGDRGAGGQIGPNATLIFEVELLSIK